MRQRNLSAHIPRHGSKVISVIMTTSSLSTNSVSDLNMIWLNTLSSPGCWKIMNPQCLTWRMSRHLEIYPSQWEHWILSDFKSIGRGMMKFQWQRNTSMEPITQLLDILLGISLELILNGCWNFREGNMITQIDSSRALTWSGNPASITLGMWRNWPQSFMIQRKKGFW